MSRSPSAVIEAIIKSTSFPDGKDWISYLKRWNAPPLMDVCVLAASLCEMYSHGSPQGIFQLA